jgi:hypothetical protein
MRCLCGSTSSGKVPFACSCQSSRALIAIARSFVGVSTGLLTSRFAEAGRARCASSSASRCGAVKLGGTSEGRLRPEEKRAPVRTASMPNLDDWFSVLAGVHTPCGSIWLPVLMQPFPIARFHAASSPGDDVSPWASSDFERSSRSRLARRAPSCTRRLPPYLASCSQASYPASTPSMAG